MTKKDQTNRFHSLMGSLGKMTPMDEPDVIAIPAPAASVAKSKNKDYQRTTVYLPKVLHRRLKAAAAHEEREISDMIEALVTEYLDAQTSKHLDI